MYLYITIKDKKVLKDEVDKLRSILSVVQCEILGHHKSRGYITVFVRIDEWFVEEKIECITKNIYNQLNPLEVDKYMKIYYVVHPGFNNREINSRVRILFENMKYQAKICNSYSENGNLFVCVRISNIDPTDIKGINTILKSLRKMRGITQVFIY